MKLSHITIQTDVFEKEIDFYQKYVGLMVDRDMRPMGKNELFSRRGLEKGCRLIINR